MRHSHRFGLVVGTIAAGLALRTLPLGLPPVVVKHGGSLLWALMVFAIVALLRPGWTPPRCGAVAVAVTSAVELSQLVQTAALDDFRATGIGALLLGRVFSPIDLIVYAIGVAMGVMIGIRNRLQQECGDDTRPDSGRRKSVAELRG